MRSTDGGSDRLEHKGQFDPRPQLDRPGAFGGARDGGLRLPVRFLPSIRPTVIELNELIGMS